MWKHLVGSGLLLRTLVRELRGIREQLTRQSDLLERVCLAYGLGDPRATAGDQGKVRAETGVDFLDPIEAGLVEDFIGRTETATGHKPSDEEILTYLADEKTQDLHQRIQDRVARLDLARLERQP